MPQFSDAFVLFASMMQMCEIFMIYARKTSHLEIFKYSSIQVGQEGFSFYPKYRINNIIYIIIYIIFKI